MFFRSERFHRQRVNFFTHAVTECRVDELVTLYQSLTCKGGRNDQCTEMLAVAFDFQMRALKAAGDVIFNAFRCGQHDFAFYKNEWVCISDAVCSHA